MVIFTAIVTVGMLTSVALAGGTSAVVQAEYERLSHEMARMAERHIWTGVERRYVELEALNVQLSQGDYTSGAYSAMDIGDVHAAYRRLEAASKLSDSKEITDWMTDIDAHFGYVELVAARGDKGELTVTEMPFDLTQRKSIEFATQKVTEEGTFSGLLPRGEYQFCQQAFTVQPGISFRLEVSPAMRREGLVEPVILYRDEEGNPVNTP